MEIAIDENRIEATKAKEMCSIYDQADEMEQAFTADFLGLTITIVEYFEGTKTVVKTQVGTAKK